ncbi:phospholipase A2 inhibitor and Ly6/PLAUR domain-containing protein-like [Mauremys reevesii]|uniref:phospholipase A2 inhibitor and Ly6/PLAUR domain-containing protein-like n=1 Tax=Mauremys reevesii TaxID=260615 RepID=UPI00193FE6C2|nr:phospholipase A2 inhibitor and Ly6/PLAUR domain-containing protein-like [Mauremys reevesii]
MEASLVVCTLAALLATGACLQCEVCFGLATSCTGDLETCAAGEDSCGVALTESTLAGIKTQSILKGCMPSSQCKAGPVSVNFGQGMRTQTSFACCVGDACRTTTVTVPPADTTPNGRRCPACVAVFADQCSEKTIQCTGDETRCVDIVETLTAGGNPVQMVMKGCASESVCAQIKLGSSTFAGLSADLTTAKCTVASGAVEVAPGPGGLLLLKLRS